MNRSHSDSRKPLLPGPPSRRERYESLDFRSLARRWDARAVGWDDELRNPASHLNEDDAYNRFLAHARQVILKRSAFCSGNGMLDLGCGTGLVLAELASHFAWAVGIDISPEMVRTAEAKRIHRVKFLVHNCFELEGCCPPAGAIISRGILLSHYGSARSEALLDSARQALLPDGFVLFDFLNRAAQGRYDHSPEEKTWFDQEEICRIAKRAGFRRCRVLGDEERRVLVLLAQ